MKESVVTKWIIRGFGVLYPYVLLVVIAIGLLSLDKSQVMSENQFPTTPSGISAPVGDQMAVQEAMQQMIKEQQRTQPPAVHDATADIQKRGELALQRKILLSQVATYELLVKSAPDNREAKSRLIQGYQELLHINQALGDTKATQELQRKLARLEADPLQ